jgi:hypothetical protein
MLGGAGLIVGLIIGIASASGASGKTKTVAGPTQHVTTTATATATATETATVLATETLKPTVVKTVATRTRTATVTYTPAPKKAVGDGTYEVGVDIKPGDYRTKGESECYWERDGNLSGKISAVIANDNIDGPTIIHVNSGEYLKLSGGCKWRRS